ncbi:hypothetical protein KFK09_014890 [Dendrobium nobile]|uniref:Uncharacterized protein n=1 Tax=Dendrobium nobile TaxID=94219 RepID=A0A8T3B5N3_DENNO|nr:hypothetical protein KFK09_014890 [Dendrobium nobile]
MAYRIRNHEKSTYRAVASLPSVESLLGRLNHIDVRLRQLEESVRPQESCFSGDLRSRNKPQTSTMEDAHVKHRLMDRLRLLETKIRQLSNELHKGSDTSYRIISSPDEKQMLKISSNSSRRMVRGKPWRSSAENVEKQRSKKVCCTAMLERALRWMRSSIFCTGDEHCCLNSSLSDDCEAEGIHAGCYH